MPIDYSKWDNLDEYSSDEEVQRPQVTTLDKPSQVTFGGGPASVQASSQVTPPASIANPPKKEDTFVSTWTEKGGQVRLESGHALYWSQDRYTVSIRVDLSQEEKVASLHTTGFSSFADRHAAIGTTKPHVLVTLNSGIKLLDCDLPHPVHFPEDEDTVDWSVESSGSRKWLQITFQKAAPMQGLLLWWRRPTMDFEEIDPPTTSREESDKFLESWNEAHRLFREKRQQMKWYVNAACIML